MTTSDPDTVVEAVGLGKDYGAIRAVEAIDLRVRRGEFFGFLGPNGAGKTTTIHMLTTLVRPSRGTAIVAGHDVVSEPLAVRENIGLVFQETTLDPELSAEENLRLAGRLYGFEGAELRRRIDEVLGIFELGDRRHDHVRTFSGGMRRLVDLARGILHRPEILFLDEPTIGLDPVNRQRLWVFLERLAREEGITLFLTTHYLEEAEPCDRVVIVDRGRVIAQGTPAGLKRDLGHGESIDLAVRAPDALLLADIRARSGAEPRVAGDLVVLSVDSAEDVLPALLPLIGNGIDSVSVRKPTLDDVFIAATAPPAADEERAPPLTFTVLAGVVEWEFKRTLRSPARLASTFARPLIWLVIIGSGFSAEIPGGQFGYHKYLLPGIMGMVILFSSLLGALGSVHDREFGSMRMFLIAPVPRGLVVTGKALSSALLGACFAVILSPLMWLFHIGVTAPRYLGLIGAALLTGAAISCLGMLVASRVSRLENFAVVMNFVIFPMFFLSGALYPSYKLPDGLQPFVRANPLTYGVDLMRHAMLGNQLTGVSHVQFTVWADIAFLAAFAVVALTLASRLFGTEGHLAAMFLSAVPRNAPAAPEPVAATAAAVSVPVDEAEPRRTRSHAAKVRGALASVVDREFKRALRQRGRLASTFARPLLWLIAIGYGFSTLIPGGGYQTYLLPGIIGMAILFSALLSALGSVHDRQFGPMRMLLIAPVSRGLIVLGKTLSSTLLASFFAIVLSLLAWVFGVDVPFGPYLEFVGAVVLTALALSALGMLAASFVRQLEDFAVAMNFVIFPLFFLSGALYPAKTLPGWLQPLVRINPLTYGVDLMRRTLLSGERRTLSPVQFSTVTSVTFLVVFTVVALTLAVRRFGGEDHLAPMFLSGGARRRTLPGRSRA